MKGFRLRSASYLLLGVTLGLGAGPVSSRTPEGGEASAFVAIESVREVPSSKAAHIRVKEYVLRLSSKDGKPPVRVSFGGPERAVQDEIRTMTLVDEHLLVTTPTVIAVFDRRTGREEKFLDARPTATLSPNAERVAYKEFQPRFIAPEDSTTIVRVLDVRSLAVHSVFPEAEKITQGQFSDLVAPEDDPARRHIVTSELFWSPQGTRLLFFCTHFAGMPGEQVVGNYVVVVELGRDLSESRFVHQEILPSSYRKPQAEKGRDSSRFSVGSVKWLNEERVEVVPSTGQEWLKERIVLDLPSLD